MLQLHFTDEVEDTQNKKVSHISTHTRLPLKKKNQPHIQIFPKIDSTSFENIYSITLQYK